VNLVINNHAEEKIDLDDLPTIIKDLRSKGKLLEAKNLALRAYQVSPDDGRVANSLGWVFYDELKNAESEFNLYVDKLQVLLNFVKKYPNQDLLVRSIFWSITRVGWKFSKSDNFSNLIRLFEIVQQLVKILPLESEVDDQNTVLVIPRGVLDENLNDLFEESNSSLKSPGDKFVLNSDVHESVMAVFNMFLKAFEKDRQKSIKVLDLFGLNNFSTIDYQPSISQGKKYPSLVELVFKLQVACAMPWQDSDGDNVFDQTRAEKLTPWMIKTAESHPEYEFARYQGMKLLCELGEREEALKLFTPFAIHHAREAYVWEWLGKLTQSQDNDSFFNCLCKALVVGGEPQMLLSIKQEIIPFLLEKKYFDVAKFEVDSIIAIRQKAGWKIPPDIERSREADWYQNAKAVNSFSEIKIIYQKYADLAEKLLPVDSRRPEPKTKTKGTVKLNPKGFGFAADAFISPDFVQRYSLKNGDIIVGNVTTRGDGKKRWKNIRKK
jgi:hypothetical protein